MRAVPPYPLWIGHAGDLQQPRLLFDLGISAVIDVAADEPATPLPREMITLRVPLLDGAGNPRWRIRLAVDATAELMRAHVPVLICCSAGMSRSLLVAAAGLSQATGADFDELFHMLRQAPADVSISLWNEIRQFVRDGGATGSRHF